MSEVLDSHRAIEKKFGIEYVQTIIPSSEKVLSKIRQRASRKLIPLYNRKQNRWVVSLYGEKLSRKAEAPYLIKKVNPLVGHGVFAKEKIPYLSYIGEYAGELRRRRRFKDKGNDYIFGYMVGRFGTPWIIDAEKKGNFTRFINHSFDPNINSRGVVIDGVYHVIFFANRSIAKGEQLTYDYGPTYWNKRPYPQEV